MAEAYESITQVVTASGLTVRVWYEEAAEGAAPDRHSQITTLIRDHADSIDTIATAIRTLPAWAAYEIKDAYGNGRVVYSSWP